MKISTVIDHIDSGHMALPEFQRGYVWNRNQVRGLFESLYKGHPVGGLLVWATESHGAASRGNATLASGTVKLLLDGQQRITSLYGVVRGRPPAFFDGNPKSFTDLRFNLDTEAFAFYQPVKMRDDPKWIDVTAVLSGPANRITQLLEPLKNDPEVLTYMGQCQLLRSILDRTLHVEEVTGADKTVDVVVDIFNRVNSGGTKLSQGDLALAKICSDWPEGRDALRAQLATWKKDGLDFSLDWLLRCINVVVTGEARFTHLHDRSADDIKAGLKNASKHIDTCLNLIGGRLGLDHTQVFFSKFAVPVMVRLLDRFPGGLSGPDRDRLLFWYFQTGMWGRFSGSVESIIDSDLGALEAAVAQPDATVGQAIDALLKQLRLSHGNLRALPEHFDGHNLGARFYSVLYALTRLGDAQDWDSGLTLKSGMHGKMSRLEVHHIFPKAKLKKLHIKPRHINALANFCFLTKSANLEILDGDPAVYLPAVEDKHPGALASQWIPADRTLWTLSNWEAFQAARRELLANALNQQMMALLHGDAHWLESDPLTLAMDVPVRTIDIPGGVADAEEEAKLQAIDDWVQQQGLPAGEIGYELVDDVTGQPLAVLDLAWPRGLQTDLSDPVAVLLNETDELRQMVQDAGYRVYRTAGFFRNYVEDKVLDRSAG